MLLLVSTFKHQVLWLKNKIQLNSTITFIVMATALRSQLYLTCLSLAVDATVEDLSRLRSWNKSSKVAAGPPKQCPFYSP